MSTISLASQCDVYVVHISILASKVNGVNIGCVGRTDGRLAGLGWAGLGRRLAGLLSRLGGADALGGWLSGDAVQREIADPDNGASPFRVGQQRERAVQQQRGQAVHS